VRQAIRWICADRHRPWVALVMSGWLLFMGARYAQFASLAAPGYEGCQRDPPSCEGRDIYMSIWTVLELGEGSYVIRKISDPVPVVGEPTGLSVGDRVSVTGRYDPERQVIVEEVRMLHRWRRLKEALSIAGLLGVMVMLPFAYTWRDGAVVERG